MEQGGPGTEVVEGGKGGSPRLRDASTLGLSYARCGEAQRRAVVIAPLTARQNVSVSAACEVGRTLGVLERTIYELLRRWQRSGGLVSSLAPHPSTSGRGKSRLTAAAEQLVVEAIRAEKASGVRRDGRTELQVLLESIQNRGVLI